MNQEKIIFTRFMLEYADTCSDSFSSQITNMRMGTVTYLADFEPGDSYQNILPKNSIDEIYPPTTVISTFVRRK